MTLSFPPVYRGLNLPLLPLELELVNSTPVNSHTIGWNFKLGE